MPTNEHMPDWCRDCPNKEYCPIHYTSFSWDCYRCKFYISNSSVIELVNAIQSNQAKGDVKDDDQLSELRSTD